MRTPARSPAQLRNMFGANLRHLSESYPSVSSLARQLGINRTQFNRYLSGESFPRPDVLARICDFFDVDARVLLEPVDQIGPSSGPVMSGFLKDFMGEKVQQVPESDFPSGFYQFSRRSFVKENQFVRGLIYVLRQGNDTHIKGYEPKLAMAMQGIPPAPQAREYRGFVLKVEDGVVIVTSRRNGLTASMNFLNRVTSFENNFWVGYATRTARENSASTRVTRLVYEHLGNDLERVMPIARYTGFCALEDLVAFHQNLLQHKDPMR
ncbi:helix-turn-helix domain-containing protein [Roseobacter litoralis]|uniref:helix-turn-helix domain-containing protein n=1 Tax=Roseobacter litoralis TaxID=42443 RepID=UPI00249312B6|nr:helix-turn-helix transcriptional regulator [Roseobacter litoralis]